MQIGEGETFRKPIRSVKRVSQAKSKIDWLPLSHISYCEHCSGVDSRPFHRDLRNEECHFVIRLNSRHLNVFSTSSTSDKLIKIGILLGL